MFEYTHRPSKSVGESKRTESEIPILDLSVSDLEAMDHRGDDIDLYGRVSHNGTSKFIDVINLPCSCGEGDVSGYVRAEAAKQFGSDRASSPSDTAGYVISVRSGELVEAYFVASTDREQVSQFLDAMRTQAHRSGMTAAVQALSAACEMFSLNVLPV